jgi:hypothetical protein
MAIKSVPQDVVRYTPSYGRNREDEKNPTWVTLQPLSRRDADKYRRQIQTKRRKGFRDELDHNIFEVQRKQFTENVLEVHNFLDFKSGNEITDVEKFYDEAPDDLIQEIFDVMLDASLLSEEEEKNFKSLSDGQTKEKDGTAATA